MQDKAKKREAFSSRIGFILACIGSAVGMGNIWMFPYRAGQYGGGAFLIPYFIFVIFLGFTGVAGEMAFGRAMGTGPLGAFKKASMRRGGKWGEVVGIIPVIGSLGIAIGYAVVVGWIINFLIGSITGSVFTNDSVQYFVDLSENFGSVGWHITGIVIVFLMMVMGVSKGIERINKVLMPAFFFLFIILAIRVFTLDGVEKGYDYLLNPDWELLKNPDTWVYALGQAFFSLSVAGSGTIVYGSYLKKDEDIINCAKNVAFFDTCAAILAGLVIIPAVFAFGFDPASGPPLMFITMPSVFKLMPMGQLFAIIFFVAVLFAAITSLMNLFETPVEALQEKFGLSRFWASLIIAVIAALVGLFIESGDAVGAWMDGVSIYIIPLGALLAGIMFYWVCEKGYAREQVQLGRNKKIGKWFEPASKYLFVGITLIVYILNIIFKGIG